MSKKIIIFVFILLFAGHSFAQQFYYYYDKKIEIKELYDKVFVQFERNLNSESYRNIISSLSGFDVKPISRYYPHHPYQVLELNKNNSEEVIEKLKSFKEVISSSRAVQAASGKAYAGISNEIMLHFLSPDQSNARNTIESLGLSVIEENKTIKGQYRVSVEKGTNTLSKSQELYETGEFLFCEPDFVNYDIKTTNDPYFPNQWPLKNTGQNGGVPGADIKIEGAWAITRGRPEIKVAIVDDGVDLNHPDLMPNLLSGYDASGGGNGGGAYDTHGSSCAGIIGAVADNNIGIAGVAPKCKIIPISTLWQTSELAGGILWAAQNDADVISNSWKLFGPSATVESNINWATTNGRGGLGCVVVFASGNDYSSTVVFPSSLPNVICVGALLNNGTRTSYSNYGDGLDITAPGGADPGDVWTCDTSGGYYGTFNGTSAACPHVAGVAALVLSVNPCLNWTDVKKVLELSADKTGAQFCGSANGLWNNQYGNGKLNAENAVRLGMNFDNLIEVINPSASVYTSGGLSLIGVCGLASAVYYGTVYDVTKTINIDYNPSASYLVFSNGINGATYTANPSAGTLTLSTRTTFVEYTQLGQTINQWFPTAPPAIKFWVIPYNNNSIYLQNRTENNFTNIYRSKESIYAGRNVTTLVSQGNYVLNSQNNVKFVAKDIVALEPGFECATGNTFEARIGGYNTCNDYPNGLERGTKDKDSDTESGITKDNDKKESGALVNIVSGVDIDVYPNPATDIINVIMPEQISKAEIMVVSIDGRLMKKATAEKLKTEISIRELPAGTYIIKVNTPTYSLVRKIIKMHMEK